MYYIKCLLIFVLFVGERAHTLNTTYEWKRLEFDYNDELKAAHLKSGFYNPDVPAPIDVDAYYKADRMQVDKRVFITIPRFSVGSPITVGELANLEEKSPVLLPYPSIEWHDNPKECRPNRLVSVFRTKMDSCGRFWVLDSGRYDDVVVCPPQIIAFNMSSNEVAHRFEFPQHLYDANSTFVTPTVEVMKCDDVYVYMADTTNFAIAVYSTKSQQSWLVKDKTMAADPTMTKITIEGTSFELMDGIMGMDIFVNKWNAKLYFAPLTGNKMTEVKLSDLRNQNRFKNNPNSSPSIFKQYKTGRSSQSAGMSIDRKGIAYFGLMSKTSVNYWNTNSPDFGPFIKTYYKNKKTMQFPGGVKVIKCPIFGKFQIEELWVMTSRFQKFATNTMDFNEVNFRISVGRIGNH